MKSKTEIPYQLMITPYLQNLQEKQDKILKMLLKKNNRLEFKQLQLVKNQNKYISPQKIQIQLPQISHAQSKENDDKKYRKYKNFYYSDQKDQQKELSMEQRVQEILDRICNVKKKQINDLRPESNLMKRKGYSVDLQRQQQPSFLQKRQKSVQQSSFNYFLQPSQVNSESDWLEFVFG